MGKIKKSTKKFLKSKLDKVLTLRKQAAKYKGRKDAPLKELEPELSSDSESDHDVGFEPAHLEPHEEDEDQDEEPDILNLDDDDFSDSDVDDDEYLKQLASLKEKDPKFYDYLKENDEQLLSFEASDSAKTSANSSKKTSNKEDSNELDIVTLDMVKDWADKLQKNSLRSLKQILLAFKAVAAIGDDEENLDLLYKVEPGKASNLILLTTIKQAPLIFDRQLYGVDPEKRFALPSAAKKWKKIQVLVKSFLTTLLKLLNQMTDLTMIRFVLKSSEEAATYFACFPKLGKEYLKELLRMWAGAGEEQISILAFLSLRKLAVVSPNPYIDSVMKGTYQALLASSRSTNAHTWTHLMFMINCIVEVGGLHLSSAYQHMFVALRQLALQIRSSNTSKTKESFKSIYNWSFLHSIRLWGRMLCTFCDEKTVDSKDAAVLRPLIYPFVQIAIGVMRLKPSAKYFPFRLHVIRILTEVGQIFESAELKSRPKPSTLKPLDFLLSLKAPNNYLGTKTYHKNLVEAVVHQLFDFYSNNSHSIAFPELAVPALVQLKRIMKHGKDFAMNKQIQSLVEKLEQNSKYIESHRTNVSYAPTDYEQCKNFLRDSQDATPLYKYNVARKSVQERQLRPEMVVAGESEDNEDAIEVVKGNKKAIHQESDDDDIMEEVEGASDMDDEVAEFVLSDMDE